MAGNLDAHFSETGTVVAGRRSKEGPAQELGLNAHERELADCVSNELPSPCIARRCAPIGFALRRSIWRGPSATGAINSQRIEDLLPEVLPLLADVEKTHPQLMDLYVVRGGVYVDLRRRDLAERDLKRAIELNPSSKDASAMLGRFYIAGGQPRESLSYYTITAALDPKDFMWQGMRCLALSDMALFDDAESACSQARTIGPSSPWVYSISSSLEAARGRMGEALQYSEAPWRATTASSPCAERAAGCVISD